MIWIIIRLHEGSNSGLMTAALMNVFRLRLYVQLYSLEAIAKVFPQNSRGATPIALSQRFQKQFVLLVALDHGTFVFGVNA